MVHYRVHKIKLCSLVGPSDRRKQSERETVQLLLTTHLADPAVVLLARRPDWRLATRVVTFKPVEWTIDFFATYKSPGVDGIFPALLQQVIPYLVRIVRNCLATGS
jgi:hypothetical protein